MWSTQPGILDTPHTRRWSHDSNKIYWAFSDQESINAQIGSYEDDLRYFEKEEEYEKKKTLDNFRNYYRRLVLDRAFYMLWSHDQEELGVPTLQFSLRHIADRVDDPRDYNVADFLIRGLLDWARRAKTSEFTDIRELKLRQEWPSIQADFIKLGFRVLLDAGIRMHLAKRNHPDFKPFENTFFARADTMIEEKMEELETLPVLTRFELINLYPSQRMMIRTAKRAHQAATVRESRRELEEELRLLANSVSDSD
jgi:hypothetical protein